MSGVSAANGEKGHKMGHICDIGSLYAPNGQRKYINAGERARFLAAAQKASPQVRTLCLVLAFTGCRISEALNLACRDIQPAGLVAIRSLKKRGKFMVREVPVPAALYATLKDVHGLDTGEASPEALLWPWGRTRAWGAVKAVMAAARIYHLAASPKGLRHGFGVHAVCAGVPLNLVQKWLGHEDIATTAIYTNVLGPEERAIAGRMW